MPPRKTGLYIESINVPIVDEVMKEHHFVRISPAINFIIQEYAKSKGKVAEKKEVGFGEAEDEHIFDGWFIEEKE